MKNAERMKLWSSPVMRNFTVSVVLALLILILAQAAQAGDWPMKGHDAAHTGVADEVVEPPLELLWKYTTGNSIRGSSPAVSGGVVYVGSDDNNVYALDAANGAMKWKYATGDIVYSSPAVSAGVVYVGSNDNNVYALDAAKGALKWKYTTGAGVVSSPAVSGGVVYVGSDDKNMYALDAANGAMKWKYATGNSVFSSPAISGDVVYVGSYDYNVYALDAANGAMKWKYPTGYYVSSSPTISGGVVYVGSMDKNVYALDAATGTEKWKYPTGRTVDSSPAVSSGVVYVGSADNNMYALDAATGAMKWNYATGDAVSFSSPAVSGGVVYVGSHDSNVYAFVSANTGKISLTSSPSDAEVLVDGISKGKASPSLTIPGVAPGSHSVKCRLSGYSDYDANVTVTTGGTVSVNCTFKSRSSLANTTPQNISAQPDSAKALPLAVTLTSDPPAIAPNQTSTITVSVKSNDKDISEASVMLVPTDGKVNPRSGATDLFGQFTSSFTASNEGNVTIKALVRKAGYDDAAGEIKIAVAKQTLAQATAPDFITGKVTDIKTGEPLFGAIVTVDGKSDTTGMDGRYELRVSTKDYENITITKSGYEILSKSIKESESGATVDFILSPISGISWFWIITILLIIGISAGAIYFLYWKKKKTNIKPNQEEKKRFCNHCGAPMPKPPDPCTKCGKMPPSGKDVKTCHCGEVIPAVAKFCGACGARQAE